MQSVASHSRCAPCRTLPPCSWDGGERKSPIQLCCSYQPPPTPEPPPLFQGRERWLACLQICGDKTATRCRAGASCACVWQGRPVRLEALRQCRSVTLAGCEVGLRYGASFRNSARVGSSI